MPSTVSRTLRTATAVAVACAGFITAAAAASPAGASAPLSTLTFSPPKGFATTPMSLVVPQPCPSAATNVIAEAVGKGFPQAGQPVVSNSTSGISHSGPFALPLQDTFEGFAADNGSTLGGDYRITVQCINRLHTKVYASFSATVTFSDANHYTAPAVPQPLVDAINGTQPGNGAGSLGSGSTATGSAGKAGTGTAQAPHGSSGSTSKGGAAAPGATSSTGAAPGAAGSLSPEAAGGSSATSSSRPAPAGFSWQPVLVIVSLLLIFGAIALRVVEVRGRTRRSAPTPPSATRTQPSAVIDVSDEVSESSTSSSATRTLTSATGAAQDNSKGLSS